MSTVIGGYATELIEIQGIKFPIIYRPKTSDEKLLDNIFVHEQYELPFNIQPKFIIDGGGNVGFAAIYFANKYPDSTIISIEPEESNYEILKYNAAFYKNIITVKSALWNDETNLIVRDIGRRNWGFIVEPCEDGVEGSIKAITIGSILEKSGFSEIDLLKLDIEGSEKEIFSSNYSQWLPKVKVLVIEVHDGVKLGCNEAVLEAVAQYDFEMLTKGEDLIFVRK